MSLRHSCSVLHFLILANKLNTCPDFVLTLGLQVQVAPVRSAAEAAGSALVAALSPFAIDMVLPVLLESLDLKVLWQSKVAAMSLLVALSKQAPEAVKLNLPTIVPVLSYCIADAKRQVKVRLCRAGTPLSVH